MSSSKKENMHKMMGLTLKSKELYVIHFNPHDEDALSQCSISDSSSSDESDDEKIENGPLPII